MTRNRLTVGKVEVVAVSDGSIAFRDRRLLPRRPQGGLDALPEPPGGRPRAAAQHRLVRAPVGREDGTGRRRPRRRPAGVVGGDLWWPDSRPGTERHRRRRRGHGRPHTPPRRPRGMEHYAFRWGGQADLPQRPLLGPQGGLGPPSTGGTGSVPSTTSGNRSGPWPTWASWS